MEYCERETLRQLIDSGELQNSDDRVWRLFREIVEGLEHVHSKVNIQTRMMMVSDGIHSCASVHNHACAYSVSGSS